MAFGPSGHVHGSQNQLCLAFLDLDNYLNKCKKNTNPFGKVLFGEILRSRNLEVSKSWKRRVSEIPEDRAYKFLKILNT